MTKGPDDPVASPADTTEELRRYWDHRAAACGSDGERIELSQRSQRMRFETFLELNDVTGRSVLDIGSGVGDFWNHLRGRGIACEYLGIDVSRVMVARASERFPDARFDVQDLLHWNPERRYDYTVAFAIHNVRMTGAAELLEQTMRRQFELCTRAAHVSILTDRYTGFASHIQAWRAEDILTLALSVTPFVVLRHDYLPNDFSVTLYRAPLIDARPDMAS